MPFLLTWINFNTLRLRQNGCHFTDDTFKHIFLNENVRYSIKISPKFFPTSPINNIPALGQIMAWYRPGDMPLSEPIMVRLPTHICITRPQWVNYIHFKMWDEITYPFPNFNGATVEVWESLSNFIPHCTGHVIAYPCWDSSYVSKTVPWWPVV